ncbi:MAG: bifunctional hydroxymethylpyrimidine kinase/phosphomethylpyrimidine kinase, partial [Bdellovibrionales bacterium]|nr:bifunctional hydroxymethylpyrimidine kinase/phosphomethylpyrimidine kinase [Bdellovibrionales bacterium]
KPNRAEAERATGIDIVDQKTALEAAKKLREQWTADMMMVTLGEDGLVLVSDEHREGLFLKTVAKSVYDVSGAGDTVTAVFAAALGAGKPVSVAGELANIAAGIVVSEVGTVPITREKLLNFLNEL